MYKWSDLVISSVVNERELLPVLHADDEIKSVVGD